MNGHIFQLRGLKLRGFRRFADSAYSFGPGLTVIGGPNESGKSTLLEAIQVAFFGPEIARTSIAKLRNWEGAPVCAVAVEYAVAAADGFAVRGEWRLERDLIGARVQLWRLQNGNATLESDAAETVHALVAQHLGIEQRSVFQALVAVVQSEMSTLAEETLYSVGSDLERVLTGTLRVSAQDALEQLRRERDALRTDSDTAPARIEKRTEALAVQIEQYHATVARRAEALRQRADISQQLVDTETRNAELADLLERAAGRSAAEGQATAAAAVHADALQRLARLQEIDDGLTWHQSELAACPLPPESLMRCESELHTAVEAVQRAEEHTAFLQTEYDRQYQLHHQLLEEVSRLSRVAAEREMIERQLPEWERERREAEQHRRNGEADVQSLREREEQLRNHFRYRIGVEAAAAAVLGTSVGGFIFVSILRFGVPPALVLLLLTWIARRRMLSRARAAVANAEESLTTHTQLADKRRSEIRRVVESLGVADAESLRDALRKHDLLVSKLQDAAVELEHRRHGLETALRQRDDSMAAVAERLRQLNVDSIDAALQLLTRWQNAAAEEAALVRARSALLGTQPAEGLRELEATSRTSFMTAQERLMAFGDFAPSAEDIAAWENEYSDLLAESALLQRQRDELDTQTAAFADDTTDPGRLEGGLEYLRRRLVEVLRLDAAYAIAIEELQGALDDTHAAYLPELESRVSDLVGPLTNGRYTAVRLAVTWPRITVVTAEGRMVDSTQLSAGAVDQLFFALRAGCADLLAQEIRLPMILDDPFVNFDRGRRESAMRMLEEMSGQRQLILLTHDPWYEDWARWRSDRVHFIPLGSEPPASGVAHQG